MAYVVCGMTGILILPHNEGFLNVLSGSTTRHQEDDNVEYHPQEHSEADSILRQFVYLQLNRRSKLNHNNDNPTQLIFAFSKKSVLNSSSPLSYRSISSSS